MIISDEQLSAFLDAELSADEMELIRQQLCEDENLANRLAELAMIDEQVANHYARINEQPMPAAIRHLLSNEQSGSDTTASIITFPGWKRIHRTLQQHAAMAASVALVIGFGAAQVLPGNNSANNWNTIAQVLDTTRSGAEQTLGDGSRIKPRLSFTNRDGNFCRQFQVIEHHRSADSIACHINNEWQLTMTVYSQGVMQEGDYHTASGVSVLDAALDEMMQGDALDGEAESSAIKNQWQ